MGTCSALTHTHAPRGIQMVDWHTYIFRIISFTNEHSSFHWLHFVAIENGKYHENQWKHCEPTEDTATWDGTCVLNMER